MTVPDKANRNHPSRGQQLSEPYAGTYKELEDLAHRIDSYQRYVEQAEIRRREGIETETKNIEFELGRISECQSRLVVLLQELGLTRGIAGHGKATLRGEK